MRHGERIDSSNLQNNVQILPKYDPELTEKGNELAKDIGIQIATKFRAYIDNNGIKLYSSPFTRTLESAISMRNSMQTIIKNKNNQELIVLNDIGEYNMYSYDIYPITLYYLNGKKEKETKLYEQLIINKIKKSDINYDIKSIDYGEVRFPESQEEAHLRYESVIKRLISEMKGKTGYLIILMTHGEGVCAAGKYLHSLIKDNNEKKKHEDYFNNITGYNQPFCNSLCFKLNKNSEVSYCCNIIPNNL